MIIVRDLLIDSKENQADEEKKELKFDKKVSGDFQEPQNGL